MWKCRPGKWLLLSPVAALPFLAGFMINTDSLNNGIANRVNQQLAASGTDWAKMSFDGRDATLAGDAPSQEAIDKAAAAVAGTYGVRTLSLITRIVVPVPPVVLTAPTIEPLATNNAASAIKGTWQEGVATTLAVTLAGKTYNFGSSPELTSNAGNWVLKPAAPLADGSYDVTGEVSDGISPAVGTAAPAKIVIDTVAPTAAVVTPVAAGTPWPFTLVGTWPEGDAISLVAKLADKAWTLGKDDALKSDGKGNWSFAPVIDLKPGKYDLTIETTDAVGNVSTSATPAAIVVAEAPVPEATPVPAPKAAEMAAPTVKPAMSMDARPVIEGSWSEGIAKGLSVIVGGTTYVLGKDAALTSDGAGNWKLKSDSVLKDGSYEVVVEATDAEGKKLSNSTGEKITVDAAAPAPPTVALIASETSPSAIKGTWAEGDAKSLQVSMPKAGVSATLGEANNPLTSDGAGNWSLSVSKPLEPGSYDVVVETKDGMGRVASDQTKFEINVKAPPAPPPAPPAVEQAAPTVAAFAGDASPSSITGTWDEAHAKGLKITVPGANLAATLGTDAALTSVQGAWTLALANKLSPGSYNVVIESTDAAGKVATDSTTAEIYIKASPPPPAPAPAPAFDCEGAMAKISIDSPIRFEFGRTRLVEPYSLAIEQYAALLKDPRCSSSKAMIAGHADYFGPQRFNQLLSELRAQEVVAALSKAGVEASRLSTEGMSEVKPLDPKKSIDARRKNRRVEIILVK
jgi:outer membrane protein OmpA-like peptidoglycan-associated protein